MCSDAQGCSLSGVTLSLVIHGIDLDLKVRCRAVSRYNALPYALLEEYQSMSMNVRWGHFEGVGRPFTRWGFNRAGRYDELIFIFLDIDTLYLTCSGARRLMMVWQRRGGVASYW